MSLLDKSNGVGDASANTLVTDGNHTDDTAIPAIELVGIAKRFHSRRGVVTAVERVDLVIGEGEFFSLLGPSGCGKTTTLRMIGGFEEPTEGQILLYGKDVVGVPPNHRDVNMVFQSYALFPHMSVFDNVAFGLRRKSVGRREIGAAGQRDARAGAARRQVRPPPARAVRRPAAARRAGAGAGQPAARAAARRAARRPGPQAAPGDADRAQAHPARGRHHVHLRHPRPERGADDVRPARRHERRPDRAARRRRARCTSGRAPGSSPASSARRT